MELLVFKIPKFIDLCDLDISRKVNMLNAYIFQFSIPTSPYSEEMGSTSLSNQKLCNNFSLL